ncbi:MULTISPECIES: hypothetical protein [unclassified Streptomyces]|uniref:hypothetical protein n=1 Tax=unclassified Streptomyces TaxID=2593676 RepID=UPI00136E8844|nr:hypothetical protein [Streptomyces sp. DvalAA-14]MYS22773.1 hypothetical protein [Streptomyces sp. SID4948]
MTEFGRVRIFSGDVDAATCESLLSCTRLAWDIETNGLEPKRNLIGTCQLYSPGLGPILVVGVADERPPHLSRVLADADVLKIFHHAPFDLSFMAHQWGVSPKNIGCTKIAAKLLRPSAPAMHHSLQYLMKNHFGITLEKGVRFTDWVSNDLTSEQVHYAVGDVAKLLDLYDLLLSRLQSNELLDLYDQCRNFLPTHVTLRLHGCPDPFHY